MEIGIYSECDAVYSLLESIFFQSYFIHTRICPVDIPPKCHTNLFATADFVDPHTEYVLLICINMKLLQHKFDFEIRRIDVKNKIQIWSQYLCSFFLFL